jgi:GNAT superfamily N-acetyltransferase
MARQRIEGGGMIRQAVGADESVIRKCAEQAYARYVPLIGRKPAPMVADFAEHIAAGQVHVAVDDEHDITRHTGLHRVLCRKRLRPAGERGGVPHAAGRGIGKALIAYCEDVARKRGVAAVRLYTNEKMAENLSIYDRLGYSEVERRTEDGFNRVYFIKRLG